MLVAVCVAGLACAGCKEKKDTRDKPAAPAADKAAGKEAAAPAGNKGSDKPRAPDIADPTGIDDESHEGWWKGLEQVAIYRQEKSGQVLVSVSALSYVYADCPC